MLRQLQVNRVGDERNEGVLVIDIQQALLSLVQLIRTRLLAQNFHHPFCHAVCFIGGNEVWYDDEAIFFQLDLQLLDVHTFLLSRSSPELSAKVMAARSPLPIRPPPSFG